MPKRRFKRKRRKFKKRFSKVTPYSGLGPLAPKLKARLVYSTNFTLNPGVAGIPDSHYYGANTLAAPELSGHQPRGWDQLMTMYDHAVCIGSKITVHISNQDTTYGQMVALLLQDDATPLTIPNNIMEYRWSKVRQVGAAGGGNNVVTLSSKCNPNKFLGRSKPLSDPNLKNTQAMNCTEQAVWHIYGFNSADADTGNMYCRAVVEYTAIFIEPKQPTVS